MCKPESLGDGSSLSMGSVNEIDSGDYNKGNKLIQRIHKVLSSKRQHPEQQQNITDELQKFSMQELTSLIELFDSVAAFSSSSSPSSHNSNDKENHSEKSSERQEVVDEEIYKFTLCSNPTAQTYDDFMGFYNGGSNSDSRQLL